MDGPLNIAGATIVEARSLFPEPPLIATRVVSAAAGTDDANNCNGSAALWLGIDRPRDFDLGATASSALPRYRLEYHRAQLRSLQDLIRGYEAEITRLRERVNSHYACVDGLLRSHVCLTAHEHADLVAKARLDERGGRSHGGGAAGAGACDDGACGIRTCNHE